MNQDEIVNVLTNCVMPYAFDTPQQAAQLALTCTRAARAIRTPNYWQVWLRRDYRALKEMVRGNPQYAHLERVIFGLYQMMPDILMRAGGIRAVVQSKHARAVGSRIEPWVYLEEQWTGSSDAHAICISYRHTGVHIQATCQSQAEEYPRSQWIWPSGKVHYYGGVQSSKLHSAWHETCYHYLVRQGHGTIVLSDGSQFEGAFEEIQTISNVAPISRGVGVLRMIGGGGDRAFAVECVGHSEEWGGELTFQQNEMAVVTLSGCLPTVPTEWVPLNWEEE